MSNRATHRAATIGRQMLLSAALLSLLVSTANAQNRLSTLSVTFGPNEVRVTGAKEGARVVAFGIGLGTFNDAPLLTRHAQALADEDRDGTIAFRPRSLPESSVWVAVDMETGEYVLATPTGAVPTPLDLPPAAWHAQRAHLDIRIEYLEVLVVRPGVAAWTLRMGDGGSNDADGRPNGVLTFRLDRMKRLVGENDGPPVVIPRDLIVAIDPHTLQAFVSEAK